MDTEYGPLMIEENGKSYLDFEIKVIKQKLGKGLDGMSQIEDIGSWNVGAPGTLELKPGASQALKQFSSKTIYRIVTVQVSCFAISDVCFGNTKYLIILFLQSISGVVLSLISATSFCI